MAQGLTNVRFVGGVLDGKQFFDQPSIMLRATHKEFTGTWVAIQPNGQLAICKSDKIGKDWVQIHQHVYQKGEKDKDGFFVYTHTDAKVISRCVGTTKKGAKCDNSAKEGINFCTIHERIYGQTNKF